MHRWQLIGSDSRAPWLGGQLGQWDARGGSVMRHEREDEAPRRGRRRRTHGRHRRSRERAPEPAPSAEDRAYRAAQGRANRRASFYTHAVAYGATLFMLLVTTRNPRVLMIVATAWGIGLALHYFGAVVVPDLRQRWIDEELGRNAKPKVDAERRDHAERKVRSLEDLSASIAHEIRNPITAAKSLVQQMGEDPTSGSNVEFANVALGELDRVERSISHLLRYARDEELRIETLDVADLVDSALETFRDRIEREGVRVERDLQAAGFVRGDGEKLRRVVINLIANALDAVAGGVRAPTLWISAGENLAGSEAWVRVRDNGPGIDDETLRKIFDPFYTTKDEGTGLGLATSKKLVETHGGTLEVDSEPGVGTEFVVAFPRDPEPEGARR
jgi:signal transduction histidine kinase